VSANKEKAPEGATTEALVSMTHEKEIDMSRSNLAQAKKEFTIFRFGGKEIRVIDKDGDPWFVAKDVCGALELTNSRKALTSLDDDEKGVTSTYTPGGNQEVAVVSESGMYTLVLRCRDAVNEGTVPHKFRKWVTAEVIPAIRKTGEYVKGAKTTVDQRTPLRDAVNMLVGKKGLRYDDAYNMVHQRFAIDSIDELELEQIPMAVEYIHRIVLDGEYLGKQEAIPAPALDIDYPLTWWNQYDYVLKSRGVSEFSHTNPCRFPVKMLFGDCSDAPSPALRLLADLSNAGYNIDAVRLEILAHRHYADVMYSDLERIRRISDAAKDRATGFSISAPAKPDWR